MVSDLKLEPQWDELRPGDTINFLAEMVVYGAAYHKHLVRSAIHNRLLVIHGNLPRATSVTILQGVVHSTDHGMRIHTTSATYVLAHRVPDGDMYHALVEVCAGAGYTSQGMAPCGFHVKAVNELREPTCAYQHMRGQDGVVQGDLGEAKTIAALHAAYPHSALLLGGFSCQPWSALGDRRQMDDDRSWSLIYALRAAFWLRSYAVILECVQEAGQDPMVQQLLAQFCQICGFHVASANLSLHTIMPARRERWWAVLSHHHLGPIQLAPLPTMHPMPVLGDLLPVFPEWEPADLDQLVLDRFETDKFVECGGLDGNIWKANQPSKTALHGWANQLQACHCGCRMRPLSDHSNRRVSSEG